MSDLRDQAADQGQPDHDETHPDGAEGSLTNLYWGFETHAIPVEGGIRPASQSGRFTKSWWAGRWLRALPKWVSPSRLSRRRAYARHGQVLELEIRTGSVAARVQGTRQTPYRVHIETRTLTDPEWIE